MKNNNSDFSWRSKQATQMLFTAALFLSMASCAKHENPVPEEDLAVPTAVSERAGTVLWSDDPNKNYLESFYRLSTESGESASVTTVNDGTHGKVWAINKPSGSKRAEFSRTEPSQGTRASYTPKDGEVVYIGWRMKVDIAGTTFPSGGFAVFQNKSNDPHSQNYPFLMGYDGKTLTLTKYVAGSGSQASRGTTIWSKAVSENSWATLVLGIKFSKNANDGYIKLWHNGSAQDLVGDDSEKKVIHRTLDDNGNYFKWGAYNETARNFNITAYLTDMKVGTTYDVARPQ